MKVRIKKIIIFSIDDYEDIKELEESVNDFIKEFVSDDIIVSVGVNETLIIVVTSIGT